MDCLLSPFLESHLILNSSLVDCCPDFYKIASVLPPLGAGVPTWHSLTLSDGLLVSYQLDQIYDQNVSSAFSQHHHYLDSPIAMPILSPKLVPWHIPVWVRTKILFFSPGHWHLNSALCQVGIGKEEASLLNYLPKSHPCKSHFYFLLPWLFSICQNFRVLQGQMTTGHDTYVIGVWVRG